MKFLCDQCKAKYQIADEKVQGKTLRMKCRKCGHVIEIRSGAAADGPSAGETMQVASLSEEAASAALAGAKRPTTPQPAPGKAAAPKPAAPRPAAGTSAAARPAAAPRPGAAKPAGAPRPGDSATKEPAGSALANAFSKSVSGPASKRLEPPPSAPAHDPPAEEWYVAIDEVPVGPIRLSELRSKYAQGAVTDDSLVWREGFEEWRPLRTMTELHGLVREEVSGAAPPPRGSLLPQTPPRSASTRAPAPAAAPRPASAARPAPAGPAASTRGNVIPFVQARGAVAARKLDDELDDDEATRISAAAVDLPSPALGGAAVSGVGPKLADDPFAAAPSASDPFAAKAAPAAGAPAAAATQPAGQPFAQAGPATIDAPADGERMTMIDRISVRARGVSKGVVALIAAACVLLGVVVAVVAVKPKVVERVVEKRVDVPVSVYVPVGDNSAAPAAPEPSAAPEPTAPKVAVKAGGGSGTGATPTPAAPTSTGNSKLKGLDLGPEGPAVPGAGGGGGGGAPLEGKAVETVVASKRVGVRKKCYEPWSDKGGASVKIRLKIAPSGAVESASIVNSSGEAAVGQCVQSMARGWSFPASGSGGTFDLPFIFST